VDCTNSFPVSFAASNLQMAARENMPSPADTQQLCISAKTQIECLCRLRNVECFSPVADAILANPEISASEISGIFGRILSQNYGMLIFTNCIRISNLIKALKNLEEFSAEENGNTLEENTELVNALRSTLQSQIDENSQNSCTIL
jgi:hypothetical protein